MSIILILLLVFIAVPLLFMWQGFVLQVMWSWFVVPPFGLPELTITQCIGLMMTVHFLAGRSGLKKSKNESDDEWERDLAISAIGPAFILLMGWIVTWFM
jgi:hypothetical protein